MAFRILERLACTVCVTDIRTSYQKRFDSDLRRFLDTERICMPVFQRYFLEPKSVWLCELVDASLSIAWATDQFSGSNGKDIAAFLSV
jgi:hypothetical protein